MARSEIRNRHPRILLRSVRATGYCRPLSLHLAARVAAQRRDRDRDDAVLAHVEFAERHAAAVTLELDIADVLAATRQCEHERARHAREGAPHRQVPGCGGVSELMKLLSMSEASWICWARSRTTFSASLPWRTSISSPI